MGSFFEKLIGSQTDEPKAAKAIVKKPTEKKPKAIKQKFAPSLNSKPKAAPERAPAEEEPKENKEEVLETEEPEKTEKFEEKKMPTIKVEKKDIEEEGQLAIDVLENEEEIIVQSTVGGVKPHDIEVIIENGIVKINGQREKVETIENANYLLRECHWGSFSRLFVLPADVDSSRAEAVLKEGVLTVKIPKIQKEKVTKLLIK